MQRPLEIFDSVPVHCAQSVWRLQTESEVGAAVGAGTGVPVGSAVGARVGFALGALLGRVVGLPVRAGL